MEAVSMKCPNCMGDVIPFGNGVYGRCNSCDSVFKLKDGPAKDEDLDEEDFEEEDEEEEDDDEEGFDFEEFFQDFYDEHVDEDDLSDAYFADRLEDNPEKIAQAVKYFEIEDEDDADEVYCVVDTTIFGSGKVGFAVTVSGIYMKDEDGDTAFIDWDAYDDDCDIERDGGKVTIGGHPFVMSSDEAKIVARMMRALQE
jgi:hypothetical protein